MSRSKKDKKGGHYTFNYNKECSSVKRMLRRRSRHQGKRLMEDAPPDKSTGGWLTWAIIFVILTGGGVFSEGRRNETQTQRIYASLPYSQSRSS